MYSLVFTALSIEVSSGVVKLGAIPMIPLCHNYFDNYGLMHHQKLLLTPRSETPKKCFQSGPTLAKATLLLYDKTSQFLSLILFNKREIEDKLPCFKERLIPVRSALRIATRLLKHGMLSFAYT